MGPERGLEGGPEGGLEWGPEGGPKGSRKESRVTNKVLRAVLRSPEEQGGNWFFEIWILINIDLWGKFSQWISIKKKNLARTCGARGDSPPKPPILFLK